MARTTTMKLVLVSLLLALSVLPRYTDATPVRRQATPRGCRPLHQSNVLSRLFSGSGDISCEPSLQSLTTTSAQTCPVSSPITAGMETMQKATCPWEYQLDEDTNRYPRVISMAVCKCNGRCMSTTSTGGYAPNSRCEAVYYNMKVLKRTTESDGTYRYQQHIQRVPVACSCLRNPAVP